MANIWMQYRHQKQQQPLQQQLQKAYIYTYFKYVWRIIAIEMNWNSNKNPCHNLRSHLLIYYYYFAQRVIFHECDTKYPWDFA